MDATTLSSLEIRPGIFVVGCPKVGKRTILSRLLSVDFDDSPESTTEVTVHGWTIDTKYYTADVSVWVAHLGDGFSLSSPPVSDKLSALVMVFDMNELSTLLALQEWVSQTDINKYDILLCVGNKVDLVPSHPVHAEYRRRLLKHLDSADPSFDSVNYGITETEGSSLLGDEETPVDIKRTCFEWCCNHGIEFVEACASNTDFDKCLSVDGDSQGVERIYGALTAHMWPGMILKAGDVKIMEPSLPQNEDTSDEESEYELEYEMLSAGSADPWEDVEQRWVSAGVMHAAAEAEGSASGDKLRMETLEPKLHNEDAQKLTPTLEPLTGDRREGSDEKESEKAAELEDEPCYEFEDLEQLMSEIGNMRGNLRLMPDFQRRERAAKLAMRIAAMFGGDSDEEDRLE